ERSRQGRRQISHVHPANSGFLKGDIQLRPGPQKRCRQLAYIRLVPHQKDFVHSFVLAHKLKDAVSTAPRRKRVGPFQILFVSQNFSNYLLCLPGADQRASDTQVTSYSQALERLRDQPCFSAALIRERSLRIVEHRSTDP